MGRKKTVDEPVEGPVEVLPGTEEYAAREFFAKEKAAYEERTGETVNYELAHPVTSTPLAAPIEEAADSDDQPEDPAEGEE